MGTESVPEESSPARRSRREHDGLERPVSDARFSARQRLRKTDDFRRVYRGRCRASDSQLLLYTAENGLGYCRLGVSVSRRWGNAVRRNRIKRLFREAFRLHQAELPGSLDLIMIPNSPSDPQLQGVARSLVRLADCLARKLGHRRTASLERVSPLRSRRKISAASAKILPLSAGQAAFSTGFRGTIPWARFMNSKRPWEKPTWIRRCGQNARNESEA